MAIPLDLSPSLWLDASDLSAGALATWEDLSGNNNDATQSTPANQPTVVAGELNGLPVVRFDGTTWLLSSGLDCAAEATICVVASVSESAVNGIAGDSTVYGFLYQFLDTGLYWGNISDTDSRATFAAKIIVGTPSSLYVNGEIKATLGSCAGFDDIEIGRGWGTRFGSDFCLHGDIAELLVFPTALSDTDRQAVETYLNAKWFVAPATFLAAWAIQQRRNLYMGAC